MKQKNWPCVTITQKQMALCWSWCLVVLETLVFPSCRTFFCYCHEIQCTIIPAIFQTNEWIKRGLLYGWFEMAVELWYSCLSFSWAMAIYPTEVLILKGSNQGFFRVTFDKLYWMQERYMPQIFTEKNLRYECVKLGSHKSDVLSNATYLKERL